MRFLKALGLLLLLILALGLGLPLVRSSFGGFGKGEKVAVISIKGVIREADAYLELLNRAEEDGSIKAVVLRVNSPGGVVGACQEIYEKVKQLRKKKPVVVSMESIAASGGLYVSIGATKIVANPGTITGSIGVILQTYNLKRLAERIGIRVITVKSGPLKDLLNPFEEPKPNQIKVVQELINDSYRQFVKAISEERGLPVKRVEEFADGRVFTGEKAKELGIVDYLGNFDRAVKIAKELCGCPKAKVVFLQRKRNFLERLLGREAEGLVKGIVAVLNGEVEGIRFMYLTEWQL